MSPVARLTRRPVLSVEAEQAHAAAAAAEQQIDATLAAVFRKSGFEAVERNTPLTALIEEEDGYCLNEAGEELSVHEVRVQTFARLLDFIFAKGPDPRMAVQRLYTVAKELRPSVICGLSHEQIGMLLGETRANGSARALAIFGGLKAAAGLSGDFGSAHKSATSRAKMSASAKGNQNRKQAARSAA